MKLFYFCLLSVLRLSVTKVYENVASFGTATQIDTWPGSSAADAIDGNTDGRWGFGSIAITWSRGSHVWWKLTFPTPVLVDRLVMWHRTDCCCWRYGDMRVFLDGVLETTLVYTGTCVTHSRIDNIQKTVREITVYGSNTILDAWVQIAELEVFGAPEDVKCYDASGTEHRGGDSYEHDGKTCTCSFRGLVCRCEGPDIACPGGTFKWTDQVTCQAKCIKHSGYCSSTGDPHYRTFDGKYFDFHGQCSYQAASCGDFAVNFKNVDFYNRAPRYTLRAELAYKGAVFAIANKYQATVNGFSVQVPYIKTYKNGDEVRIENNGQLEITLNQLARDRTPAVRVRATNAGSYIQAGVWLHGSCADLTQGICGNFNGNPQDDLTGGSANSHGEFHAKYDEDCPAPPPPFHPCDTVEGGRARAEEICDALRSAPFLACHSSIPIGDGDGGVYLNCVTDVCNCFLDRSCACSQYDNYASACIEADLDLSDWRREVAYCPYTCPEGLTYAAAGSVPAPTCLDKKPEEASTARGCFCPAGQYLQEGVCVAAAACRCLFEGAFLEPGDKVRNEGGCAECECGGAGDMTCSSLTCPTLACTSDQLVASKDDLCCPYCELHSDWVEALNPTERALVGQDVVLTCQVNAGGVGRDQITWNWSNLDQFPLKGNGVPIEEGVSDDGRTLKLSDVLEGFTVYSCTAQKGGHESSAFFELTVVVPAEKLIFEPSQTSYECKLRKKCKVVFAVSKPNGDQVTTRDARLCKLVAGERKNCVKAKAVIKKKSRRPKKKQKKTKYIGKVGGRRFKAAAAGEYVLVLTQDGKQSVSDPVTVSVE